MTALSVNIDIDAAGLQTIRGAKLAVTMTRAVYAYVGPAAYSLAARTSVEPAIAWLVFEPLAANQIILGTDFFLYMTTMPVELGNVLTMNSITQAPVQIGQGYLFQDGHFSTSSPGKDGAYTLQNQAQGQSLCFGLAQNATVNGTACHGPLNVTPVIWNTQATFIAQQTIEIFLSSCDVGGTVIPAPSDGALSVTLSSSQAAINVGFNDATNRFYLC